MIPGLNLAGIGIAAAAIFFLLWRLILLMMWRIERVVFFHGVRQYLEDHHFAKKRRKLAKEKTKCG